MLVGENDGRGAATARYFEKEELMNSMIALDVDLKPIAFAWPGGYPVYYLAVEGFRDVETSELLDCGRTEVHIACPKCAANALAESLILTTQDVNYEDAELYCDICGDRIESAYAEPEGN
jgi:hypothetical protein